MRGRPDQRRPPVDLNLNQTQECLKRDVLFMDGDQEEKRRYSVMRNVSPRR
ncbi:hypothetical protein ACLBOM_37525 [Escherichia coli]